MIFFHPGIRNGETILPEEESQHAIKVLRLSTGDSIRILDGEGGIYQAVITQSHPGQCSYEITQNQQIPKPDYSLHLAIAPTKNSERVEWMVEKCVEIGLQELSFVVCEHSERSRVRLDRLEKKMISAMKQSGQSFRTKINGLSTYADFIGTLQNDTEKYIAYINQSTQMKHLKEAPVKRNYVVLIGPEGDFSKVEVDTAMKAGFHPATLGNSILRTETAGLKACCILNSRNE